jgi:hypothetical protein
LSAATAAAAAATHEPSPTDPQVTPPDVRRDTRRSPGPKMTASMPTLTYPSLPPARDVSIPNAPENKSSSTASPSTKKREPETQPASSGKNALAYDFGI